MLGGPLRLDPARDAGRRRRGRSPPEKARPGPFRQRLLNLNALLMRARWVSRVVGCSMRNFRTLSRFALIGVVGGLSGACSETARLNPFPDLFGSSARTSSEPPMTGSVAATTAVPSSRPLAPPAAVSQPAAAPAYNRPAAAAPAPKAVPAAQPPVATGPGGWTAQGGTAGYGQARREPQHARDPLQRAAGRDPVGEQPQERRAGRARQADRHPGLQRGAAAPARPAAAQGGGAEAALVQGPKAPRRSRPSRRSRPRKT